MCWKLLQGQSPNRCGRRCCRGLLVAANSQPELAGVFSTYAADTPQIYLDIDRDKAQVLGIKISDIFNALQSTLGSYYVNDFNVFGRNLASQHSGRYALSRADRRYRADLRAQRTWRNGARCARWRRRSWCRGRRRWCAITATAARSSTARRNRAIAPARRSPRWSACRRRRCRPATASNGPAPRFRKRPRADELPSCSGLAILFAYLFLVALYESWNIPVPALLSVSVGILGALIAVTIAGLSFDVYAQIGLVALVCACRQERHPDRCLRGGAA